MCPPSYVNSVRTNTLCILFTPEMQFLRQGAPDVQWRGYEYSPGTSPSSEEMLGQWISRKSQVRSHWRKRTQDLVEIIGASLRGGGWMRRQSRKKMEGETQWVILKISRALEVSQSCA